MVKTTSENTLIETHGLDVLEQEERTGTLSYLFTMWFSTNMQFSALALGALVTAGLGLNLPLGLISVTLGTLLGAVLLGLMSMSGPRVGTPQIIASRGPFGFLGNSPNAIFVALNGLGWFTIHTLLIVSVAHALWGVPSTLGIIISVLIQLGLTVAGFKLIHYVQRYAAFILFLTFAAITIYVVTQFGTLQAHVHPQEAVEGAFFIGVAATGARAYGYAMYASDHTRYLPSNSGGLPTFLSAFGGCFLGAIWTGLLGAILGWAANSAEPAGIITGSVSAALATPVLIVLALSTLLSTIIDLYSGSLAFAGLGYSVKRIPSVVIMAVIGLGIIFVAEHYSFPSVFRSFLLLSGYWIAPWAFIIIIYYLCHKNWSLHDSKRLLYDKKRNGTIALLCLCVAIAVSVPFMDQTFFQGIVVQHVPRLGDIAYAVGSVVAVILTLIFARPRWRSPKQAK